MPVYILTEELIFPDPLEAPADGLLALGGDLTIPRIKLAYRKGIFPWYSEGSPILWWSPDPRMVLLPENLRISKSLRQVINRDKYEARFDTSFEDVIQQCSTVRRKKQSGTWITGEMKKAYIDLYHEGYAHSVETYENGELVGGLYGLSFGKAFFGESMFHLRPDASKVALYHLVERLKAWDFDFIDAQQETTHLKRMGAQPVPRKKYLKMLEQALKAETKRGVWKW